MDTNASFIVQKLDEIGVETRKIVTIHDDEQQLLEALRQAAQQSDWLQRDIWNPMNFNLGIPNEKIG